MLMEYTGQPWSPGILEAEAGGLLGIQRQPGIQRDTSSCGKLTGITAIPVLKPRVVLCWVWWHTLIPSLLGQR